MMNRKGTGRKRSWSSLGTVTELVWRYWEIPRKLSLRIAGSQPKFVLNTSRTPVRWVALLIWRRGTTCLKNLNNVVCRPVARRRLQNKHLYNSRCFVITVQTMVVARQWLNSSHVGTTIDTNAMVFSRRSLPRCYTQGQLAVAVGLLVSELVKGMLHFSHGELLLLEAGSWGWGLFGSPEDGERPPLEAATKQRLVKNIAVWEDQCVL
jgi:hypothetical protein